MKKKKETCKYCGEKMDAKTTRQEFCGTKCRVYWNRENIADPAERKKENMKAITSETKSDWKAKAAARQAEKEKFDKSSVVEKIAHYELELAKLLGNSEVVAILRNRYNAKIHELKKLIPQ